MEGTAFSSSDLPIKIYVICDQKVMLGEDLAELYGVETRRLNEQVKRNEGCFRENFLFTLTEHEFADLKSQNTTSSWGGRRKLPNAFTEHGVLMLSSVLNSPQSIQVNIQIMRMFYSTYEKLSPMVAEIGSSHNMLIIKKCKGELERDFLY